MSEELVALVKRLVSYDSAEADGVLETAGFIEGWLDSRGIQVESDEVRGLPVLKAEVGPEDAPTVVLHGHIDVVPAPAGQFEPRVEGDRLYGRGAYDMKGGLAAMLLVTAAMRDQDGVRVRLGIVGDEESEEEVERGQRPSGRQWLPWRLRDYRRADRSAHRGRGQGGAGAAGDGRAASLPTERRPGWAKTRF